MTRERLHSEKSFAVAAHPHLSLYMTGSKKGRMQLWKFNNQEDTALDEYVTNSDWNERGSDMWNISRIKFNLYGDKFAVNDREGNFYVFELAQGNNEPEITIKRSPTEILDFAFLNQGTVLCAVGLRPSPNLVIYDTLMPPGRSTALRQNVGGSTVLCLHESQQILLFSTKEKGMKVYDIRMNSYYNRFVIFT